MAAAVRFRPLCFRQAPEETAGSLPPNNPARRIALNATRVGSVSLSPFRNARPSGWASTRRRSPRLLGFPEARSEAGRTRRASLRRGRHGATESGERAAPRWRNLRPGWIPVTWRLQATRRRKIKARSAAGALVEEETTFLAAQLVKPRRFHTAPAAEHKEIEAGLQEPRPGERRDHKLLYQA